MLSDLQNKLHPDMSQTSDFLQSASDVNSEADILFPCNFIDFTNLHQMEQFARHLFIWL